MAYWLDDGFDTWPETVTAGTPAAGLYTRCGTWIARNIANGRLAEPVVPSGVARMYGTSEWIQRLVDVGLWAVEGDGYRDTRYFELNPRPEQVAANRAKKVEAGRKGGVASGKSRRAKQNGSNTEADASALASLVVEAPSLPLPSSKEGRGRALHVVRDWCGRCDKNTRTEVDDETNKSVPCRNCHPNRGEVA